MKYSTIFNNLLQDPLLYRNIDDILIKFSPSSAPGEAARSGLFA